MTSKLNAKTGAERLAELSNSLQKMYDDVKELAKTLGIKEDVVLQMLMQRELILINEQLLKIRAE